jgi:predicted acyltransferase
VKAPHQHLASLDAFRGMTIAAMIVVNNPGNWNAVFAPLTHADWNGCTLADVVFPFFIFILGAALAFALGRRLDRGQDVRNLLARIGRRAAALVVLGLVLNAAAAYPAFSSMRIPGVLQRIGLVYLLAAVIAIYARPWQRAIAVVTLLLGHWAVLGLVHLPGVLAAYDQQHNVAGAIDQAVFGTHILTRTGDPEGLLGTLPAVGTALLGLFAGARLRREQSAGDPGSPGSPVSPGSPGSGRSGRSLVTAGLALLAVGLAWGRVLPVNKSLWTGSFVAVTAGLAASLLAVFHRLIDVNVHRAHRAHRAHQAQLGHLGHRLWARPFTWLGFNPLAIYFLSELVGHVLDLPWLRIDGRTTSPRTWIYWDAMRPLLSTRLSEEAMSLTYAVLVTVFWTGVAGFLYHRRWRFQV